MSLLGRVTALLEANDVSHCLIGAAAMAAHGAPRSTLDLDLLTTDRRVLDEALWKPLRREAVVRVRRGDAEDPLAGVVRVAAAEERAVDLIVGRFSWQERIIGRAQPITILGTETTVAEAADVVLLKLYAGGPQDRWDVQQLRAVTQSEDLDAAVAERLGGLPRECADLWRELRG